MAKRYGRTRGKSKPRDTGIEVRGVVCQGVRFDENERAEVEALRDDPNRESGLRRFSDGEDRWVNFYPDGSCVIYSSKVSVGMVREQNKRRSARAKSATRRSGRPRRQRR